MSKRTIVALMGVAASVLLLCVGSVLAGPDAASSGEARFSASDADLGPATTASILSFAEPSGHAVLGSSWFPASIIYLPLAGRSGDFSKRHFIDGYIRYENDRPAQGFRVARQPDGTWVTTDRAGYFVFRTVPTGTFTVSPITADHLYLPAQRSVALPPHALGVDFTARADAHVLVEVGSEGVGCPQQIDCWADVDRVVYWFFSRPDGCAPMGIGDPDPYSIMWSMGQGNVSIDEWTQPGDILEVYGSCVYDLKAHLMMIISPGRPYFISDTEGKGHM